MRYKDRPISEEKYKKRLTIIGGAIIVYLAISFMCVVKVIGEWW